MQNPTYVKEAFGKIAERYVVANHVLSLGTDILWRKKVARMVREAKPQQILDLATGTGDLAMEVSRKCPEAKIIAADFCQPMLDKAAERNIPNCELMVVDAMNMPFADGLFDAVTVGFGLRNMASWPDAVREMARVIKPGGSLFVLDFSLPTLPMLRPGYRFYLHKVLPKVAGWITGQREAYEYLGGSIERFPSGAAMVALLTANGFAKANATPLTFGIASIYHAQKSQDS